MNLTITPLAEEAKAESQAIKNTGEVILSVSKKQGKLLRPIGGGKSLLDLSHLLSRLT